jgi:hypothetical protein
MAHATQVVVKNPSGDATLKISMQGGRPGKVEPYPSFVDDPGFATVAPRMNGSIGGGQFTWERRFVLSADAPTVIEIQGKENNFVAERLEAATDKYGDYFKPHALAAPKIGTKYELAAGELISFRLNQNDESLDGAYLNFRNQGDATLKLVQQSKKTLFRRELAASWDAPVFVGEIAPGRSGTYTLSDISRLVIDTESKNEITLGVFNPNTQHALRLMSAKDGEPYTVNIPAAKGTGQGYDSGQVTLRKGTSAIIQQAPQ